MRLARAANDPTLATFTIQPGSVSPLLSPGSVRVPKPSINYVPGNKAAGL